MTGIGEGTIGRRLTLLICLLLDVNNHIICVSEMNILFRRPSVAVLPRQPSNRQPTDSASLATDSRRTAPA